MLKTSLERFSQGLGWQSMGMEGCCRRSRAVHAEQCKQLMLAFPLSELHSAALASNAPADSAGVINPRMIKQGSINTNAINSSD